MSDLVDLGPAGERLVAVAANVTDDHLGARAGGVDLPGEVGGLVALDELVLHGWDLARATGQSYDCDDATAEACMAFVSGFDETGTPGLFGPSVTVGEGASAFEQVLARSGRDPQWSPA